MADIKLVVKMSQESYNNLKIGCAQRVSNGEMIEAIKNGTPIPDNVPTVDVLNKIRAEIYQLHCHPKLDFIRNDEVVDMALDIIDKYK